MSFRIIGTGSAVPSKTVTNEDLSGMMETSDEWIRTRVGVAERRIATTESTADLAYEAAVKALEMSGISADSLDLIVAATITPDRVCPTTAGTVQARLGASCPAFDISSACSGFLFALETAAGFFARGNTKRALVIGAERISKIIDWTDRSTAVIFGDGAGAAVLEAGDACLCSELCTMGGDDVIRIPAFGGTSPFTEIEKENPVIFMEGQETFKFAVGAFVDHIRSMADKAGIAVGDIDHIVPHQANERIIRMAARRLKLPDEKFVMNIDRYGNTAAASVPIALDELNRSGKLKSGDLVAMVAFGGGLSSAGCLLRW
ncbi:MAG: ketoacyl-ACP synthase III [Clostridia bacterium]|nr:ketoacyl-ACP synthase III [Clostridia bacterium]